MSTFVISDIHGAYRALMQVLDRCGFSDSDHLIFCGDVCDGWREVFECIKTLSEIKNFTGVIGNHDWWTLDWLKNDYAPELWLSQGGRATVKSLQNNREFALEFLESLDPFFVRGSHLFVHGGIDRNKTADDMDLNDLMWDRRMITGARNHIFSSDPYIELYGQVICGHTPTLNFGTDIPVHYSNVWCIDTGASYDGGKLTIMDADSGEFWQSDLVSDLYPGECAR